MEEIKRKGKIEESGKKERRANERRAARLFTGDCEDEAIVAVATNKLSFFAQM